MGRFEFFFGGTSVLIVEVVSDRIWMSQQAKLVVLWVHTNWSSSNSQKPV